LKGWAGTLACDGFAVHESVVKREKRPLVGCAVHAKRKLEETDQGQVRSAPLWAEMHL